MEQTPTNKFWAYLGPILKAAKGVEYVQLSDADRMDRINSDSRSRISYPAIFVIRPKYQGFDQNNGIVAAMFNVIFYVFCKAKPSDFELQDMAFEQAEQILGEVEQVIYHDSKTYNCLFDINSWQVEPVAYAIAVDAVWGYEVRMRLGIICNEILC